MPRAVYGHALKKLLHSAFLGGGGGEHILSNNKCLRISLGSISILCGLQSCSIIQMDVPFCPRVFLVSCSCSCVGVNSITSILVNIHPRVSLHLHLPPPRPPPPPPTPHLTPLSPPASLRSLLRQERVQESSYNSRRRGTASLNDNSTSHKAIILTLKHASPDLSNQRRHRDVLSSIFSSFFFFFFFLFFPWHPPPPPPPSVPPHPSPV